MNNATPMIILRGAPGSGKTTMAERIRGCSSCFIFETDNFFVDSINRHDYHFDPKLLKIAHSWNQGEVIRACRDCPNTPVIVANTFCQNFEMKPYFDIALTFKRKIYIFTLYTNHDNIHGVPDKKVEQMRLGIRPFRLEEWDSYPFQCSYEVHTDEEAMKLAQIAHNLVDKMHSFRYNLQCQPQ